MTEVEIMQELAECQDAESSAKTSLAQLEQTHANLALEKLKRNHRFKVLINSKRMRNQHIKN